MAQVNVRNLEQIQEQDSGRPSRIGTLLLVSLAGAAVVSAFVMMSKKSAPPTKSTQDPLAALVEGAKSPGIPAGQLDGKDVSFPRILSDDTSPTTALAAVKDERGRLITQEEGQGTPEGLSGSLGGPPPATDRLPVVPLPLGTLLNSSPVITTPRDALTDLAASAAAAKTDGELAPAGSDTGFQLQVASFKEQADADRTVEDLRKRGHRAFRQAAHVPDRGLWHRVRVGPFKSKLEALKYKDRFERTERIAPFLIDPDKIKQAEEQRAAKLSQLQRRRERLTGD
ncbi:MAG: Adventurous gliding motility protein [Polyangiaceae bacterium]|nr:Adventurous gliding motility protein [Polyangiaceae bacterium]